MKPSISVIVTLQSNAVSERQNGHAPLIFVNSYRRICGLGGQHVPEVKPGRVQAR